MRPTSDRLRETLFDILGSGVRDCVFVDLFAGTGAVGIEAISRGAGEVIFIEQSPEGNRLIRKNLEICRVTRGYRLIQQDVFKALRHLARLGASADIIFADPPYRWELYCDILEIIFQTGLGRLQTRVIIEHHRRAALPETGGGFSRTRQVTQGDHLLSFYSLAI